MPVRRRLLLWLAAGGAAPAWATGIADPWAALRQGPAILLLRHAHAPGVGDPPGMRLGDCASQRNLDEVGRAQARRIGQQLRARGVEVTALLSSRWCRARETALLAFPALALREEPAFDSFFDDSGRAPAQTAAARALLTGWRGPGVLLVVTHQVNIRALAGQGTASGEAVVLRPGPGGPVPVARLSFEAAPNN